ncbi:flagellar hook-length control protein FliK [Sphingomonas aerophila]|uniref:Flagellar hook-length control protein FliK n=1 Tax=Sphingomonas aerophila TaxID=1344948 RepID=A0A7W9BAM4_9SPHN|nr:flagellar hook-length control protein FliK [Sphingomonas aerophila]MBB5713700.1 flagellar hook-length control protein FliK [Sphingomonas aerophila]
MTIAPTSFLPNGLSPAASASASPATGGFGQALGAAIAGVDASVGSAQPVTGANAASPMLPGKGVGMDALLSTGLVAPPATTTPPPIDANAPLVPGALPEGELAEPDLATSIAMEGNDDVLEPTTAAVEPGRSAPAKTPAHVVAADRAASVPVGTPAGQSSAPPPPTISTLQAAVAADVSDASKDGDTAEAVTDDQVSADAPGTSATSNQPAPVILVVVPVASVAAPPRLSPAAPRNLGDVPAGTAQAAVTAIARGADGAAAADGTAIAPGVGDAAAANDQAAPDTGFADRLAAQTTVPAPAARQEAAVPPTALPPAVRIGTDAASPLATAPAAAHAVKPQEMPSVTAQSGRIGHEMGVHIARRVIDGSSELTVRLNPAEMGRVEVRIAFDDAGTLRATVAAERPAALDLLRRDSADLGRALNDAGVRADGQSFRFDTRAGTGDGQAWQRNGSQQDGGRQQQSGGRGYAGDTPADEPVYRALRTSGRVDLMA